MADRYEVSFRLPPFELRPFSALREKLREGYGWADLRADAQAGVVVGLVALPLGMALAIAAGVSPQNGLYTIVIAGFVVALLGGSRTQVTGPTAAFVVVLVPVAHTYGIAGLLTAGFLAGALLVLMGWARLGRLIEFIPHPVTSGFTAGIALVLFTLQVRDFLGLQMEHVPEGFLERLVALFRALPTWSPAEVVVAVLTLSLLLLWPRFNRSVPAPLVALSLVTGLALLATRLFPQIEIATIATRFMTESQGTLVPGIPSALPRPDWPWNFSGAGEGVLVMSWSTVRALLPSAVAIALLGAIESLLSAVVADGMSQTRHDPDGELVALGIGNLICPFFGGIPATGAIARTATNVRFGARSPLAAMWHAVFVLLAVLLFARYVSYLPMAALAALLVLVAFNMAEWRHLEHTLNVAPRGDMIVLVLCFSLTVLFDMVVGVVVGVMLAALLFMRRMAVVTSVQRLVGAHPSRLGEPLPRQIVLYEIAGPLFFGAAARAAEAMTDITDDIRVVILDLEAVPVLDMTGLVALGSAIRKLNDRGRLALLAAVPPQPAALIARSGLLRNPNQARICPSVAAAVEEGKAYV